MFPVVHLETKQIYQREHVLINPHHASLTLFGEADPAIEAFHRTLPDYAETPLKSLPDLARELGISHVFVKDESLRFGLPAYKILGASWAVYRAVCEETGLPPIVSLQEAGAAAQAQEIRLVTCSAGNWGRAVARMGKYLGIGSVVFVFNGVSEASKERIKGEGAHVIVVNGSYDDSLQAAIDGGSEQGSLLVLDIAWDGFEKIPQWVVDGYSTMLRETDRQIQQACGRDPAMCFVPVGAGSIAQAVVSHYAVKGLQIRNFTVEPEVAPCLMKALRNGKITPLETGATIMPGMNCGTVSALAWPILKATVHAAVAVSDVESHESVLYLNSHGINAGPCGAATLAAARKLSKAELLGQNPDAVLMLFSTEGKREYTSPYASISAY